MVTRERGWEGAVGLGSYPSARHIWYRFCTVHCYLSPGCSLARGDSGVPFPPELLPLRLLRGYTPENDYLPNAAVATMECLGSQQ